jgi:hypothetical protein
MKTADVLPAIAMLNPQLYVVLTAKITANNRDSLSRAQRWTVSVCRDSARPVRRVGPTSAGGGTPPQRAPPTRRAGLLLNPLIWA